MQRKRVVFHEKVVNHYSVRHALFRFETGLGSEPGATDPKYGRRQPSAVVAAVQEAVSRLSPEEQELVHQLYVLGRSIPDLAAATGQSADRLQTVHHRIQRRLRSLLGPFVCREYGLAVGETGYCPVCRSPRRGEIDRIIAAKRLDQTWRPIMRTIREQTGLTVRSPHVLIGHRKYHGRLDEPLDSPENSRDIHYSKEDCHER